MPSVVGTQLTFLREFPSALDGENMASKTKLFSWLKVKAKVTNKDYHGSKTDFPKLIRIPYSTWQTILKQNRFCGAKCRKDGEMCIKKENMWSLENVLFRRK